MSFKKYRKKGFIDLRPVTEWDIEAGLPLHVSVSEADEKAGSPKIGDMVARNPKNHGDQWLVAEQYFKDNYEEI